MTNLTVQQVIDSINAPSVNPAELLNIDYTPSLMSLAQRAAQAAQSNEAITLWHYEITNGIYANQITTSEFDAVVFEVKSVI